MGSKSGIVVNPQFIEDIFRDEGEIPKITRPTYSRALNGDIDAVRMLAN